jgi:hypothetical protein
MAVHIPGLVGGGRGGVVKSRDTKDHLLSVATCGVGSHELNLPPSQPGLVRDHRCKITARARSSKAEARDVNAQLFAVRVKVLEG